MAAPVVFVIDSVSAGVAPECVSRKSDGLAAVRASWAGYWGGRWGGDEPSNRFFSREAIARYQAMSLGIEPDMKKCGVVSEKDAGWWPPRGWGRPYHDYRDYRVGGLRPDLLEELLDTVVKLPPSYPTARSFLAYPASRDDMVDALNLSGLWDTVAAAGLKSVACYRDPGKKTATATATPPPPDVPVPPPESALGVFARGSMYHAFATMQRMRETYRDFVLTYTPRGRDLNSVILDSERAENPEFRMRAAAPRSDGPESVSSRYATGVFHCTEVLGGAADPATEPIEVCGSRAVWAVTQHGPAEATAGQ